MSVLPERRPACIGLKADLGGCLTAFQIFRFSSFIVSFSNLYFPLPAVDNYLSNLHDYLAITRIVSSSYIRTPGMFLHPALTTLVIFA